MAGRYDYVIVGGGSAGCVLAHRLSEDRSVDVLLLEAGEPEEDREAVKDPRQAVDLLGSDVDWGFEIEPQPGLNGRTMDWPRGKALGGSSVINAMIYVRGHPWDFDRWAELGNDGWGYDDLLPYFKRSEHFVDEGDAGYHGTDGPLTVSRGTDPKSFSRRFVDAAVEAGMERNDDFNGARQSGVGYYHWTVEDGHRHTVAAAFIEPVLDRPNLTVETSAFVTRLAFEGDRAAGVIYEREGDRHEAEVGESGEVILSAGAIQSPQLLMCSGIGPAAHLAEHDVAVRADLPGVGRNLQDHLRVTLTFESAEPVEPTEPTGEGTRHDRMVVGGFERSDPGLPAPDVQYVGYSPAEPAEAYSIIPLPLRPESRGRLTLRSADPYDPPVIDPRYLTTETDVEDMVTGVRRAREIAQTGSLAEITARETLPGPDVETDEEVAEFVRDTTITGFHPVGTCKMGDDETAVVDDRLRVRGVEGLRVIDASVMPTITSGNTHAPTLAIAEKGADLILDAR